jgi:hypothetical protein
MNPQYSTLNDGCDGDSEGLAAALGTGYSVIFESIEDWGYGHHSYDALFALADGRFIHASCGGCSCGGSGDWSIVDSLKEAKRYMPLDVIAKYEEQA